MRLLHCDSDDSFQGGDSFNFPLEGALTATNLYSPYPHSRVECVAHDQLVIAQKDGNPGVANR